MQVTPKSEAEVSNFSVFPAGIYDFEILTAVEKKSKAGNDMIEMKVRVFDQEGKSTNVFDYLMEVMAYKLRHAAAACGLLSSYEQGQLNADNFVGCTGKLKLGIDVPVGFPEKNVIKDYVVPRSEEEQKMVEATHKVGGKKTASSELNDEIPWG